jgi:hypothetical protein
MKMDKSFAEFLAEFERKENHDHMMNKYYGTERKSRREKPDLPDRRIHPAPDDENGITDIRQLTQYKR